MGLYQKWKNSQDNKQLAEYKARDAELGTPTKETLNERARKAAEKGYWKTALAAVDQGADVNQPLRWKQFYGTSNGGLDIDQNYSFTTLAIQQKNSVALASLLEKGADKNFTYTSKLNDRTDSYSLLEYAALQGAADPLNTLLANGKPSQAALNGAFKITAGEKSYNLMSEALLAAGAQGYDAALRAAERTNNNRVVRLITASKITNPETVLAVNPDTRGDAIASILESATADERRKLIAGLQAKFSGDFAAVAPKPAETAATPVAKQTYYPSIH